MKKKTQLDVVGDAVVTCALHVHGAWGRRFKSKQVLIKFHRTKSLDSLTYHSLVIGITIEMTMSEELAVLFTNSYVHLHSYSS